MNLKKYLKEDNNDLRKIEILLRDPDDRLINLINHISKSSAPGHSFDVIVDPESSEEKRFGIDGDGCFYIKNLKLDGSKFEGE